MSELSWLTFWPQCSDALDYLDLGKQCAGGGACYDTLRPAVTVLWFSLPERLGLPPTALVWFHWVLWILAMGVWGSVLARLAGRSGVGARLLGAVCVGGVTAPFLLPTFFHALSDTPATLCVLLAVGCAVTAARCATRAAPAWYVISGVLLGLAAGLRVFYLYPVLVQLALVVLWVCFGRSSGVRRWQPLWLLMALLPMGGQWWATKVHIGEWGYLPTTDTRYWRNFHQYNSAIGYDTLLPEEPYPWQGQGVGLRPALEQHNWAGFARTVAGRIYFLLGSYSSETYRRTGRLEWDYIEFDPRIGREALPPEAWPYPKTQGGGRLLLPPAAPPWQLLQEAVLERAGPITLAITLRDASPSRSPDTALEWRVQRTDGSVMQRAELVPTVQLQRHFAHFTLEQPGRYAFVLGSTLTRPSPTVLEGGDFTVSEGQYEEPYPVAPERVRTWSSVWLAVQLTLLMVLGWVWWRALWRPYPLLALWAALPLLVLAQSLVIVPEQRFVQVTEVALWCGVLLWQAHRWRKTR